MIRVLCRSQVPMFSDFYQPQYQHHKTIAYILKTSILLEAALYTAPSKSVLLLTMIWGLGKFLLDFLFLLKKTQEG